MNYLIEN